MRTSDTISALAGALAKAQLLMENATLNQENSFFKKADGNKARYADLAAVREATIKHLNANGLSIIQLVGEGPCLHTRLMHASGEWIESIYPLPGAAKPQELGSALTYARRYSWASICGIAAEDDDDGNAAKDTQNSTKKNGSLITDTQRHELALLVDQYDVNLALFCKYMNVPTLKDIPASRFEEAKRELLRKAPQ
jgi:hypothetical protein